MNYKVYEFEGKTYENICFHFIYCIKMFHVSLYKMQSKIVITNFHEGDIHTIQHKDLKWKSYL